MDTSFANVFQSAHGRSGVCWFMSDDSLPSPLLTCSWSSCKAPGPNYSSSGSLRRISLCSIDTWSISTNNFFVSAHRSNNGSRMLSNSLVWSASFSFVQVRHLKCVLPLFSVRSLKNWTIYKHRRSSSISKTKFKWHCIGMCRSIIHCK